MKAIEPRATAALQESPSLYPPFFFLYSLCPVLGKGNAFSTLRSMLKSAALRYAADATREFLPRQRRPFLFTAQEC
jgi:hypothetical protein